MRVARTTHATRASRAPVARKSAETESKPLQKHATMAIRLPKMAAATCAQSSADTRALMQSPTSAAQPAETPSSLALRNATTATPTVGMDAVQTAIRSRMDGRALPWRVVGPVARKSAETESEPLQKHATMAIRLLAMAAAPCAQSSADTRALMQIPTSAGQPAETPSSLALSNATTATPTGGMDAVQTATRLRLDGRALPWRVVGPVAHKSAETESEPLQKHASI